MAKLKAYIDGACEPVNPGGTASYGLVVKSNGITIFTDSAIVGNGPKMSNNVAEYSGLIAFLEWYVQHGDNMKSIVYSDSSLLVNQMTGRWRVQRGLYLPYYEQACQIIRENTLSDRISFRWVRRDLNEEADRLSKDILITHGVPIFTKEASHGKARAKVRLRKGDQEHSPV